VVLGLALGEIEIADQGAKVHARIALDVSAHASGDVTHGPHPAGVGRSCRTVVGAPVCGLRPPRSER
jgi:hypothetical protein